MAAFTPSNITQQQKYVIQPFESSTSFSSDTDVSYILDSVIRHRESRNVEFKAAQGNYIINTLPEALSKYACAFANGEGGTMYLGILDNGIVKGIPWYGQVDEDRVHRTVRNTLDEFLPNTPSYTVRIVPIYQYNYTVARPMVLGHKRVVRIEIHPGALPDIWETGNHKVWVKRDGSVEELNPLQIKDLAITRYKQSLELRGAKRAGSKQTLHN